MQFSTEISIILHVQSCVLTDVCRGKFSYRSRKLKTTLIKLSLIDLGANYSLTIIVSIITVLLLKYKVLTITSLKFDRPNLSNVIINQHRVVRRPRLYMMVYDMNFTNINYLRIENRTYDLVEQFMCPINFMKKCCVVTQFSSCL